MSSLFCETKEEYDADKRPSCKYGNDCYQKNKLHLAKYKHPPKNEVDKIIIKKRKLEPVESDAQKQAKLRVQERDDIGSQGSSCSEGNKADIISEATGSSIVNVAEDELLHDKYTSIEESIERKFLVKMPEDFYKFWQYCMTLNPSKPQDALESCGLTLVGAFDVLAGKDLRPATQTRFLCHWRYYYDPPEFQTVLAGDKGYHIGYFRDSPSEFPVFVASMSSEGKTPYTITPLADNIFDAVRRYCLEASHSGSVFRQQPAARMAKQFEKATTDYGYKIDSKDEAVKKRRSRVVCRSLHGAGIVVPYDKKTQVGYRELPETEASLKRMFKKVAEASKDAERACAFSAVQELVTNAQWANDECDFGMSLELGLALFLYGSEHLEKPAAHLLCTAYSLLDRDPFAVIVKAHLKNRRKGYKLSAFD